MTAPTVPVVDPAQALSEAAKSKYDTHGLLLVPGLFPVSEMEQISKVFTDKVESDDSFAYQGDSITQDDDVLKRYPRFVHPHRRRDAEVGDISRRLFFDPRVFDIVTNLIGPAYGAQSMFHFKPPTARGLAPHQDNYFLHASPNSCLAAWIAMDVADVDSGGLIVVPGTHKYEVICHGETDSKTSWTKHGVTLPPELQGHSVQTSLKPGDVMFFHGSVVHGSNPNTSDHFRRSMVLHYIPRTNTQIHNFYFPLLVSEDEEVTIDDSPAGGICGEAWNIADGAP